MADTGRVGDDFGKFRIQFENGATVIGMHGSFIAISQTVEELITYDHGDAGSICEDLYFALYAFGHHNVRFDWVDGFMYEQSPFTMMDLIKQRQRWFSGMFLVCFCNRIPLQQRLALMLCCFSWNLVPMMALITLIMTFIEGGESYALWRTVSFFNALMMQSYLIGFVMTYSISEGFMRYLVLFVMQLNGAPIFGVLEAMGAWRAMTRSEAYMGFHVVQKEVGGLSGENPMIIAEKKGKSDATSTASSKESRTPPQSVTNEDSDDSKNAAELLLNRAAATPVTGSCP
jgi:egghead protein (zeste-white 4 protein)